jgi:hypothetical protein
LPLDHRVPAGFAETEEKWHCAFLVVTNSTGSVVTRFSSHFVCQPNELSPNRTEDDDDDNDDDDDDDDDDNDSFRSEGSPLSSNSSPFPSPQKAPASCWLPAEEPVVVLSCWLVVVAATAMMIGIYYRPPHHPLESHTDVDTVPIKKSCVSVSIDSFASC